MENKEMFELILGELKSINGRLDNLEKGQERVETRLDNLENDVKDLKYDTKQLKLGQEVILKTMTYNDIDLKHTLDDIAKGLENNRLDHISFNNRITILESKI